MNEEIAQLIQISDPDSEITELKVDKKTMTIYLRVDKRHHIMYCPSCGARMWSKGIRTRTVNHPALQTGYKLIIIPTVRKWVCRECRTYDHDHYAFVEDGKQNTVLTPFLILQKFKSLEVTARHVAQELNVSDTYVIETFMMNVNLPRLPFPKIISIDEVHMKFDKDNLYAVIIMDFMNGQIIDVLPNRLKETYDEYFLHIPLEERKNVTTIISDIYKPYLNMAGNYFPNAKSIIDSFHVVSQITTRIRRYINQVKRKYQERDNKKLEEQNYKTNSSYKTMKKSREVRLLERYSWFLLKNQDDINYEPRYIQVKGRTVYFNPRETERSFLELDPHFEEIRNLKERYIEFNKKHINDVKGAEKELLEIIEEYENSNLAMYREIAATLKAHIPEIANSFTYIAANDKYDENEQLLKRISNGPMEGFNVNPKNLKRLSRGVSNYPYTRNRILWATREDPHILAVPHTRKEVHTYTGKKRGQYKKKNTSKKDSDTNNNSGSERE